MVYDALQYAAQVEKAAKSHRDEIKKRKVHKTETVNEKKADIKIEAGEYLSGFHKGDRLLPVITLVLLFNPEPWDAPMSIHDMLSVNDPKILSFVPDYRINLIAPAQIKVEDMDKFRSSLREVLLYIKYSKDKERLGKLLESDPQFRNLDIEAAVVINTVTNSGLKFDRKGKTVDMCQAVVDMRREERQEGRYEGSQELARKAAQNMLKRGDSPEEIAEVLELSVEIVKAWKEEACTVV